MISVITTVGESAFESYYDQHYFNHIREQNSIPDKDEAIGHVIYNLKEQNMKYFKEILGRPTSSAIIFKNMNLETETYSEIFNIMDEKYTHQKLHFEIQKNSEIILKNLFKDAKDVILMISDMRDIKKDTLEQRLENLARLNFDREARGISMEITKDLIFKKSKKMVYKYYIELVCDGKYDTIDEKTIYILKNYIEKITKIIISHGDHSIYERAWMFFDKKHPKTGILNLNNVTTIKIYALNNRDHRMIIDFINDQKKKLKKLSIIMDDLGMNHEFQIVTKELKCLTNLRLTLCYKNNYTGYIKTMIENSYHLRELRIIFGNLKAHNIKEILDAIGKHEKLRIIILHSIFKSEKDEEINFFTEEVAKFIKKNDRIKTLDISDNNIKREDIIEALKYNDNLKHIMLGKPHQSYTNNEEKLIKDMLQLNHNIVIFNTFPPNININNLLNENRSTYIYNDPL